MLINSLKTSSFKPRDRVESNFELRMYPSLSLSGSDLARKHRGVELQVYLYKLWDSESLILNQIIGLLSRV
jgi:hypothetical protein